MTYAAKKIAFGFTGCFCSLPQGLFTSYLFLVLQDKLSHIRFKNQHGIIVQLIMLFFTIK